ncbi:hypothetical protein BHAOGJBA_1181 [Methylobacterium hispanicum]|uniref:Uncharacterized protein n=1 Tax=Methylobacterium hispanicum TaxID=270350 RepID=A0AAV4ZHS1_9HYPH|nr:hypothetical protein [Methylobacterium hispanicum]GJD87676.1 hypothetical protein BHAOGJBA_1181 [Methylobacterium hispanicum]
MEPKDYATVRIFASPETADIFFGRGDAATKAAVKALGARFMPDKRCWRVTFRFARKSAEDVAAAVEAALYEAAPETWRERVGTVRRDLCLSRRYTLRAAIGGLRISVPSDHPFAYFLRRHDGVEQEQNAFVVHARHAQSAEMARHIKRLLADDVGLVLRVFEPLVGRRLTGAFVGGRDELVRLGVVPGSVVHADTSFMSIVDEAALAPDVAVWPLEVLDCAPAGDAHVVKVAYLEAEAAVRALKRRQMRDEEQRQPLLTKANAVDRWSRR